MARDKSDKNIKVSNFNHRFHSLSKKKKGNKWIKAFQFIWHALGQFLNKFIYGDQTKSLHYIFWFHLQRLIHKYSPSFANGILFVSQRVLIFPYDLIYAVYSSEAIKKCYKALVRHSVDWLIKTTTFGFSHFTMHCRGTL